MTGDVVVLDANVLYGIEITDLLATMATRSLFRPHWSSEILDEVIRNLALRPDLTGDSIARRVHYLNQAIPSALEVAPSDLIDQMPVNEKDRHVLALAVHVEASTIVTENLRDFPPLLLEPYGIEAVSADEFVLGHVRQHPIAVTAAVDAMVARRRRHPKTTADVIEVLGRYLPAAMASLTEGLAGPETDDDPEP